VQNRKVVFAVLMLKQQILSLSSHKHLLHNKHTTN